MQGGLRLAAISLFILITAAYLPCKAVDTQDDNENHLIDKIQVNHAGEPVSYTHLRAHETQ